MAIDMTVPLPWLITTSFGAFMGLGVIAWACIKMAWSGSKQIAVMQSDVARQIASIQVDLARAITDSKNEIARIIDRFEHGEINRRAAMQVVHDQLMEARTNVATLHLKHASMAEGMARVETELKGLAEGVKRIEHAVDRSHAMDG